jgi:hypothetical protein
VAVGRCGGVDRAAARRGAAERLQRAVEARSTGTEAMVALVVALVVIAVGLWPLSRLLATTKRRR